MSVNALAHSSAAILLFYFFLIMLWFSFLSLASSPSLCNDTGKAELVSFVPEIEAPHVVFTRNIAPSMVEVNLPRRSKHGSINYCFKLEIESLCNLLSRCRQNRSTMFKETQHPLWFPVGKMWCSAIQAALHARKCVGLYVLLNG